MGTSAKRTFLKTLTNWLKDELTPSQDNRYRHRRLEEQLPHRTDVIEELKALINEAHEDARNYLRRIHGLENTLDPLGEELTPGTGCFIIDEYPRRLPIDTLKGYFGEIFAGVIAENFDPLGEDWIVPAFLFRYHTLAFDLLDQMRQGAKTSERLVGRHGDDCLAFQRDENGRIVQSLACEAKCTPDHQKGMVDEAHIKASSEVLVPTSVSQVIAVLQHYAESNADAATWVDALRQLLTVTTGTPGYERCDLVSYICGLPPVQTTTEVIPISAPHKNYTGSRRLEAVEVHLHDVEGLIEQIYDKNDDIIQLSSTIILDSRWQTVLSYINPPAIRTLYEQQCWLAYYDGYQVVVGVRSLKRYREVQRKEKNLQQAFIKSGLFTPDGNRKNPKINFRNYFPEPQKKLDNTWRKSS
jgi:hypothetical protein